MIKERQREAGKKRKTISLYSPTSNFAFSYKYFLREIMMIAITITSTLSYFN